MTVNDVLDKINQITSARNALMSVEIHDPKCVCPENFIDDVLDLLDEYRASLYDLKVRKE